MAWFFDTQCEALLFNFADPILVKNLRWSCSSLQLSLSVLVTDVSLPAYLPTLHGYRPDDSSISGCSRRKSRGKDNAIREFLFVATCTTILWQRRTDWLTVTHLTFETGSEKYKELETSVFVSAGHFIVEKDKPVVVEYKVSRVSHG